MTNVLGWVYDERGLRIEPDVPIKRVRVGDIYVCSCYAGVSDWYVWFEDVKKEQPNPMVGVLDRDMKMRGWKEAGATT